MRRGWGLLVLLVLLSSQLVYAQAPPACPTAPDGVTTYNDYQDVTSGKWVRQIIRPTGNDRNLYHFRVPFNVNNTYMLGVRERFINDHSAANADVVLHDGNGCYLRVLFALNDMNWMAVWDKTDPDIFYVNDGPRLIRYHVSTNVRDELVDISSAGGIATGGNVTLNQDGTRIGVQLAGTAPHRFRSWELPNMTNERTFSPTHASWGSAPANCDKRNWRYSGWGNVVITDCRNENAYGSGYYQDDGTFVNYFTREIGHVDVGPTGMFAYFVHDEPVSRAVSIHLANITTGADNVIHVFPAGGGWQNSHMTWPRGNPDFFVIGFFPAGNPPETGTQNTVAPYSQLYKITATNPATVTILANMWTTEYNDTYTNAGIQGYFWTQPEPEMSADGSRALFNGMCDPKPVNLPAPVPANQCIAAFEGDLFILFTGEGTSENPVTVSGKAAVKGKATVK